MAKNYLKILETVVKKKNWQINEIELEENCFKHEGAIQEEITFDF